MSEEYDHDMRAIMAKIRPGLELMERYFILCLARGDARTDLGGYHGYGLGRAIHDLLAVCSIRSSKHELPEEVDK